MAKTYRPYEPTQSYLLPPSPLDWLPKDHLAYFVVDLVRSMDLRRITRDYAGYFSSENVAYATTQGIDVHAPTERWKHGEAPPPILVRPPREMTLKQEMTRKLRTKRGREVYSPRKTIVEPCFGQIKGARGIRSFLLRGIEKVRAEWALITATHNLLKLYRAQLA